MKNDISRRDFLKLVSLVGLAPILGSFPDTSPMIREPDLIRPNVIVILFDAMAAKNLSLYGYPRQTTPNLELFASRATVFHTHRSAGTYTTPSSASLFTGTYPWTHRALCFGSQVLKRLQDHNLFNLLHASYRQLAFTQNLFADVLLYQFGQHLDVHKKLDSYTIAGKVAFNKLFEKDAYLGSKSFDQFLFKTGQIHGSLFLSLLNDLRGLIDKDISESELEYLYPDGLPNLPALDHTFFSLHQVMDGVIGLARNLYPASSFAYFHLLSPHEPYKPAFPYLDMFNDGWSAPPKPVHPLSDNIPQDQIDAARRTYDQYIINTDVEFGRLMRALEESGLRKSSYIIVTSDHGEVFERGTIGHGAPYAYESQIRIPLLISAPDQKMRQDIYNPTTNVDILPTLLHLSGLPIPDWVEGSLLPGLGQDPPSDRSIFVVDAKENPEFAKIKKGTLALIKGDYKLIHTIGYRQPYTDRYELYDLKNDPEELNDIYNSFSDAEALTEELDTRQAAADQPFP